MAASRSLGHRAPLLWLVLPLIAGLAAGKAGAWSGAHWSLPVAAAAAVLAFLMSSRSRVVWAIALVTAMFLAGSATYALHRHRLPEWDALPPREVEVDIRVDRVFATDPRKAAGLGTITAAVNLAELRGQAVYFSLPLRRGQPPPVRSAVIRASGILTPLPANPPIDTFDGYLAGAGMNFRFNRGRIMAERRRPLAYYRFCAEAAARGREIFGMGIAAKRPALAGLLRAMMLGETHELTDEQHTLFMESGTMHLFAISGLNIGVISTALQALLLLVRLPNAARYFVGVVLLWLFVDITGAAPSAVRAFVMAAFFHGAFVFRQPANALAAIVASALVVVVVTPLQVFSASFLMSYAIVLALLLLGLPLGERALGWWTPWRDIPPITWSRLQRWTAAGWRALVQALAIGTATALVGTITGMQFFGLITPGALVANLILVPAAMGVTVAGFAATLCALAQFQIGVAWCNHAAAVLLLLLEALVRASTRLPGAFVPAHFKAAWIGWVALAALLATILTGYALNWRRDRGGWWPPFAVVALALLFGTRYGN